MNLLTNPSETLSLDSRRYELMFFSGDVPETQEDIPFNTIDIDEAFQSPLFCAATGAAAGNLNRGRSGRDGFKLTTSGSSAYTFDIPFGRAAANGNRNIRYPVSWERDLPESMDSYGVGKTYSPVNVFNYNNVAALAASTSGPSYRFGSSSDSNFEVNNHGLVLNYSEKFEAELVQARGMDISTSRRFYLSLLGWDYATEAWVTLTNIRMRSSGYYTEEITAGVITDKYKISRYNTGAGGSEELDNFRLYAKGTLVQPEIKPPQPTWVLILPLELHGYGDMPFMWCSVSGPLGDGEFIVNDDEYQVGDYIRIITTEIELFGIVKGVSKNEAI